MIDFIDAKTALTIAHVFGAVFGAGGAYMSDAMFFSSVRDKRLERTELRFLKLGSLMVWAGLAILVLSGIGLFMTDPDRYLASSKFLAKATVVGVILANGAVFHAAHFPMLYRHSGAHLPSSAEFVRRRPHLLASGAISMVSWTSALVLGMIRSIPYGYGTIISAYAALLAIAIVGALVLKEFLLPSSKTPPR